MFSQPTYLVQVGWQGKNRVQYGIDHEYIDGAILSPSDYVHNSLDELATNLNESSLWTFFDPQFYLPDQGDRDKLNRYEYHNRFGGGDYYTGLLFNQSDREEFFTELVELQLSLHCDGLISPNRYLSNLSRDEVDDWQERANFFVEFVKGNYPDVPVFVTLSVNGDQLTDGSLRDYLLNQATTIDTDGFYVSVLFSDSEKRLPLQGERNVHAYLETLLSLKYNRYEVIASNTHQIAHLLFPIGVDAFASGHFNNLRAFDVDRWIVPDDPPPRQRSVRYYSDELLADLRPDHVMSEIAEDTSIPVSRLKSPDPSPWENDLFTTRGRVDVGWPESEGAWDHYTYRCGSIASQYRGLSKSERLDYAKDKIRQAKLLHQSLEQEITEYTDELDTQFLDDWESALELVTSDKQYKRLKI